MGWQLHVRPCQPTGLAARPARMGADQRLFAREDQAVRSLAVARAAAMRATRRRHRGPAEALRWRGAARRWRASSRERLAEKFARYRGRTARPIERPVRAAPAQAAR